MTLLMKKKKFSHFTLNKVIVIFQRLLYTTNVDKNNSRYSH